MDMIYGRKFPAHQSQETDEQDVSSDMPLTSSVVKRERKVREAFHIYQRKPQINRDSGIERSAVWNAVL